VGSRDTIKPQPNEHQKRFPIANFEIEVS